MSGYFKVLFVPIGPIQAPFYPYRNVYNYGSLILYTCILGHVK